MCTTARSASCTSLGISGVVLHGFRHGYASAEFSGGEDIAVISRVLGYSTAAFTMSVYVHADPERFENVGGSTERKLGKLEAL